jgi:hypothetical protein
MSLGFLSKGCIKFLNGDLKYILSEIAERNEIGCRNEFDADTLIKNGIKNVCVIGCPSFYYHMDRNFKVNNEKSIKVKSINVNFNTVHPVAASFGEYLKTRLTIMCYLQDLYYYHRDEIHVDYSIQEPLDQELYIRLWTASSRNEYEEFYNECGRYFFSVDDWIEGVKQNDFSIGTRFHGNVAAILAGVPALMIPIGRRMIGFVDYYKIPYIKAEDFDTSKPIEYYYNMADYSEFNKNYSKTFDTFIDFCKRNDVMLKGYNI